MSANTEKQATGTIAFRWPQSTIDFIKKSAKEEKLTMQEFFLSQISPESKLMQHLIQHHVQHLEKTIYNHQDRMAEDIKRMAELTGLSEDEILEQAANAMKMMVKGEFPTENQTEKQTNTTKKTTKSNRKAN